MRLIHALAAAAIAVCGFAFTSPAEAAPKGEPAVAGPAGPAGNVILAGHRDRDRERHWRRGDRDRHWRSDRRDDRRWGHGRDDRRWRHRRDDRRVWRDDRRRRHGDWDRGRGHDRDWRADRRHGKHKGWDRKHKRWEKQQKRWERKHRRWHARQHPRHRHWRGRHVSRGNYEVFRDYDRYRLPRPRRGQFYARSGNDVFLVSEATRRIIDAFLLQNTLGRF